MRMRLRYTLLSMLVAISLALAAETAFAQSCAYCSYAVGQHRFSELTCEQDDPGCFSCSTMPEGHIGCHAPSYEGECGTHGGCGTVIGMLETDLLEAMRTNDAMALASLVVENEQIELVPERNAVQIRGCTGAVASYVHVPGTLYAAVHRASHELRPALAYMPPVHPTALSWW